MPVNGHFKTTLCKCTPYKCSPCGLPKCIMWQDQAGIFILAFGSLCHPVCIPGAALGMGVCSAWIKAQ